jgi:predicted HTH transcriptional regulator
MALENEKLQTVLADLIDRIAEKLGIGLEKMSSVFSKRTPAPEDQA